ncbi:hypothetical protein HPC49_49890 [Pyxidicoccus fallax]|uniref:Uncharacterized protein n=1 Tax=Pyxidicoccus fallax TaxID=394095 RepID=A0A848LYW6_9BACT|nr:hypothetical protein [Pyxidicoccus fallax]NMO22829.1 hypothetical protein [Pyxidicoccus fallax]NPC86286.1 hypothetical protein [Pyxidicoccus fallax]
MFVSRKSIWGHTGKVMALALTLALNGACGDDDDDEGGGDNKPGDSVKVTGKVTYDFVPAVYSTATRAGTLAFSQVTKKPVRGAVIQVRQGNTILSNATTDDQGNYEITYKVPSSGSLTIVALAKTTTPSIQVEDNTDGDAVWGVGTSLPSNAKTRDMHAGHGWTGGAYNAEQRFAAPFAILDSMYTAARAFMNVRPVQFPELKVNWSPNNVPGAGEKDDGNIGTSHFSPSDNEIYILGKDGVDTDEFDSHVIVHEWGHYFESNLSRSDSPGGPHGAGDVLDPRLSFGEGYGNALAAIILPESMYVDTVWSQRTGALAAFGFDAETAPSPSDDPEPGVFSESSVMRILYDLYDSGSNESAYDNVSFGLGTFYDVLTGPQKATDALTTLGSFVNGLKAQSGVNTSAVHALLAHYRVGAVTSDFGDGDTSLRAIYTPVASVPYNTNVTLTGGVEANKRQQNQYFVFTGTGRTMNISVSNLSEDVDVEVYRRGTVVAAGYLSGTSPESVTFSSQANTQYVLVVTGYKEADGVYGASVSITSP